MALTALAVTGYRSIRSIRFPVRRLSVLVGGNGVGKTNLYRSLELLQAAATGTLATEIARDGGLGSVHFAGQLKAHEKSRLVLEATLDDILESDDSLAYGIETGFAPREGSAAFETEAQVKSEQLALLRKKPVMLMDRTGPAV